jgi:hypothetical protein
VRALGREGKGRVSGDSECYLIQHGQDQNQKKPRLRLKNSNSSKFFVVKTKKETTNAEIPSPHY